MVREPWRPEEVKKKGEEELKQYLRMKANSERVRKEAEEIVKKRKEELRKLTENARGKPFTDEEWEKAYNDYMRGEK